ncbi:hypothetical protein [Dactylosporangium sp. CA-092794]|uniref:hypothetical protein n=1 Tax=Dactylosporangium sp. CA-092794 TaxID=3239929 RepID=UPI003D8CBCF0
MRWLTLAAGVAVGYVLGTRAGRAKYEQIVDGVRQVRANPTLDQLQKSVKHVAGTSAPADTATLVAGHPQP